MFRQEQRLKQGAIPSGLRILYKTGEIPFDAMCATSAVPDAAIEKISGAFIHMHHRNPAAHKALGSGLKISGWAPPQDARYNVIRNVVPELYGQDRRGQ